MKKIINVYLPQVLLIVFSVVLGMYLNQKMIERSDRYKANQLLFLIESEVKRNYNLVQDWQPYHEEFRVKIDSVSNDPVFIKEYQKDRSVIFKFATRGTLMADFPLSSAWEITKLNPVVSEISYDKMNVLAKTYSQQKSTFEPAYDMMKIFNAPVMNTPKEAKESLDLLSNLLSEMVGREKQLLQYYQETITVLEK